MTLALKVSTVDNDKNWQSNYKRPRIVRIRRSIFGFGGLDLDIGKHRGPAIISELWIWFSFPFDLYMHFLVCRAFTLENALRTM